MKRFDKKRTSHGVARDHKSQKRPFEQQGRLLQKDKYRSFSIDYLVLKRVNNLRYVYSKSVFKYRADAYR